MALRPRPRHSWLFTIIVNQSFCSEDRVRILYANPIIRTKRLVSICDISVAKKQQPNYLKRSKWIQTFHFGVMFPSSLSSVKAANLARLLSGSYDNRFWVASSTNVVNLSLVISLAAFSGKRNVVVWRPSVRLSVPSAFSPWLARRQHPTRPAYISARQ